MKLPSAVEINPIPECLDGKYAVEHFEGKSIEEAEQLIAENGIYYSEDLNWMGPVAFMFYFRAALAYLKSEASHGDSDFLNSMIGVLELRICGEYNDFKEIEKGTEDYWDFCAHALENYDLYDLDEEIYGDLRPNLTRLINKLKS